MRDSVELTLARLALRQVTARRRALWALLLAAVPPLLALLARLQGRGAEEALAFYSTQFQTLTVPVLLPLIALVVGTSVFGNEVEDGTLTYVLGKPVARWRIVLTRVVVAGAVTAAVLAPATLAAGVVAAGGLDPHGLSWAFAAAVAAGSFLYCALFVALSLSTRRALVAGLAYVVVWEGALSGALAGLRSLSVRQYTLAFAEGIAAPPAELFSARLAPGSAVWLALAVAALATLFAVHRLRGLEIGEAA
jgi:ABC-2 type transport system permease protein